MEQHASSTRSQALALVRSGVANAEVARRLNVPKGTVGYWVHMDRGKRGELPGRPIRLCPRCDGRALDEPAYSYLLGLYLGDGHIIQYSEHRVPSLMITCAESWPGLMDDCEAAMRAVFPDNSVCRVRKIGCRNVKIYSQHLWCMFPQHGKGKKHERPIVLEPWQRMIVDKQPWAFIRGLIHSDGCRMTNWTTRLVGGERKRYEYPRYFFTNTSDDIIRLFTGTLDALGVEWKHLNQARSAQTISIARKGSVALMDEHVGPKY
jgi:hypothetical protein